METTLLDIQIPVDQIKAATAAIGEARKSLEALREEQKNLDKGSEAYTKNAIKIKELNAEIRTNERVVMANTKAQKANEGSIEQLRAQLSQVTDQWSKLSKEERENTDAGQKLVAQKLKLTEELKRLEKQTGDTRRNVGNYSEGVKEALMQTGAFSNQFALLAKAQTAWNAIVALSNGALKSFRIALISTGIGAIVVAIGSLIAAFASTQQGVDTLNKFLKPLQFAFQRLIGVFQDVAIALSKLNFKEVWNQIKGIGGAMRQAAIEGYQYADSQVALKKAQLALAEAQGELNRKFQEQKAIVQDVTKSDKERKEAADEALAALDARTQLEANILKEQIKQAELAAKQNDTDYETQIELANLKGQLAQLEADRVQKSLEIRNQINGLDKAAAAARLKEAEELAKAQAKADEEAKKKAEKEKEELEKRIEAELKMELEAAERLAQEKINIERQRLLDGEISVDTYNKRIANMEMEALEARKAVLEQFGQDTIDINSEILAAQVANAQAQIETDKIAEETKRDQKEKTLQTAISALGEQTAAGKILSSAQAAINSYEAATLALATIPPPLGQIQAALTVIQGLAQVARINAVPIPKFATGVIGVDGPGTGTSDSITAKISAGESVMTAKATAKYAPLLASLERSVGNNPNIGKIGKGKFANGVISAGINATRQAAQVDGIRARDLAVAMKSQPIFVSLTELDSEQVRFNQARAVSVVE